MRGRSQDDILQQVLGECLTDETDYVPSDYEIRQQHHFSKKFEQSMALLLKEERIKEEKRKRKDFFRKHIFSGRNIAAGLATVAVVVLVIVVEPWNWQLIPLKNSAESSVEDGAAQEEKIVFDGGTGTAMQSASENVMEDVTDPAEEILETEENTAATENDIVADSEATDATASEEETPEQLMEWKYEEGSIKDGYVKLKLSNHMGDYANYSPILLIEVAGKDGKYAPVFVGKSSEENSYLKDEEEKSEKLKLKDYGMVAPGEYRVTRTCQGEKVTVSFRLDSVK